MLGLMVNTLEGFLVTSSKSSSMSSMAIGDNGEKEKDVEGGERDDLLLVLGGRPGRDLVGFWSLALGGISLSEVLTSFFSLASRYSNKLLVITKIFHIIIRICSTIPWSRKIL